jgi:porin
MIYQEAPGSDQGLTIWAASGLYPQPSIAIVPFQVNFGLVDKGLIPTRDATRPPLDSSTTASAKSTAAP